MKISITILILFLITHAVCGQFPFEKYPAINYNSFITWTKTDKQKKYKLVIPEFFKDKDTLLIKLTKIRNNKTYSGFKEDSCIFRLYKNNKFLLSFTEIQYPDIDFPNIVINDSIRLADFNGDKFNDLKFIFRGIGNGRYNLYTDIIYLFQMNDCSLTKLFFQDLYFRDENRLERDFDGDGNFEIVTMSFQGFGTNNYLLFNLYDYLDVGLVNVNYKDNYPIMTQILYQEKENYKITDKLTREKMKQFAKKLPDFYDKK